MTTIPQHRVPRRWIWGSAQVMGVLLTVVLLAALIARPTVSLDLLWYVVIPILPASFLVSPAIWRNVCPLATLNMVTNRRSVQGQVSPVWTHRAGAFGVILLVALVPARRFLLNTDGVALAIAITAVAGLALVMGAVFPLKSGFCNAFCPILPVERLYGQRPLVRIENPRCVPCTTCTSGCLDLAPAKSIPHTLGRSRRTHAWLTTWYGVFAAAFPGFVAGYYTVPDGPLSTAAAVYLHIALWAGSSYALVAIIVGFLDMTSERALVILAAGAAGLYYWYAVGAAAEVFTIPAQWATLLRVSFLVLVAVWLWRAFRVSGRFNGVSRRPDPKTPAITPV